MTGHDAIALARAGKVVRCEWWAPGITVEQEGDALVLVYGDGLRVPFEPGEEFGNEPAELDRDDWRVIAA